MKQIRSLLLASLLMSLPFSCLAVTAATNPSPATSSIAPTPSTPAPAAKKSNMPDDQKMGYSLGVFMGSQIRTSMEAQGLTVNQDSFNKGLKDGISNTTPQLSADEIQSSLSALQQQAQNQLDTKVRNQAATRAAELFGPVQTIIEGNPKGTITLVEFYDYECPHCKAMAPLVNELIENNKELRVVYRPFPIINANSISSATAAFAAQSQGKFADLHDEMMGSSATLTDDQIRMLIRKSKIDPKKFETAIKGSHIKEELKNNRDLAAALGLRGTPSFLIAKTVTNPDDKQTWPDTNHVYFAAGEVSESVLKDYIAKASQ